MQNAFATYFLYSCFYKNLVIYINMYSLIYESMHNLSCSVKDSRCLLVLLLWYIRMIPIPLCLIKTLGSSFESVFPQHSVPCTGLFCFQLQNTHWTHSFSVSTPIRLMREYCAEKWAVGLWLLISQLYYDYTWLSKAFSVSGKKTISIVNFRSCNQVQPIFMMRHHVKKIFYYLKAI